VPGRFPLFTDENVDGPINHDKYLYDDPRD